MVAPAAGTVVLVIFPFSDLSASKLRPAFILGGGQRGDWLLCQITSNPYTDPTAIEVTDDDFDSGSLQRTSYIRPGKIFTANASLMTRYVGTLSIACHQKIVDAIVGLVKEPVDDRKEAQKENGDGKEQTDP